jgi:hypothetical protein
VPAGARRWAGATVTTCRRSARPTGSCSISASWTPGHAQAAPSRSPSDWPGSALACARRPIAYLERKRATCQAKTVSSMATSSSTSGVPGAGRPVPAIGRGPGSSPSRRAVPVVPGRRGQRQGRGADQRRGPQPPGSSRCRRLLADITEVGLGCGTAPQGDLPGGHPRSCRRSFPATCRSTPTGGCWPSCTDRPGNGLAARALRLQRACGLRIGELCWTWNSTAYTRSRTTARGCRSPWARWPPSGWSHSTRRPSP